MDRKVGRKRLKREGRIDWIIEKKNQNKSCEEKEGGMIWKGKENEKKRNTKGGEEKQNNLKYNRGKKKK